MAQLVKNPPAMWETWVRSLGWEDPLEKGKATHSIILAWRIPWRIPAMWRIHLQCGRPGFDPWVGKIPWRRERLYTPLSWPGEFLEKSMGLQRVGLSHFHFHFLLLKRLGIKKKKKPSNSQSGLLTSSDRNQIYLKKN